jgi:hypothetical protein
MTPLRATPGAIARSALVLLAGAAALPAAAFTVNITAANPRMLFLQVGVGSFNGIYNSGGTPAANPTVNVVSVTVPAAQVGNGTAQAMTTDSTASRSFWDNFVFCTAPAQLYVGGFYRSTTNTGAATLTATAPTNLVNATGEAIPFNRISWTSSGIGDSGGQPFAAGSFTGGTQTIGNINRNQWAESCHTFRYANTGFVASGTYTGRVIYTLSTP